MLGDDELVERARSDPAAFGPLYDRYVVAVYRYCLRRLGEREAAEDATGATFTRALAALPRFRLQADGSFRAWLFTIAHHAVTDLLRERRRAGGAALPEIADVAPESSPEGTLLAAERERSIRLLLARLPPGQARVVELRLAGLTDIEIARARERSHGAVRVAQHRAVRRLRELLAAASEEERDALG